MNSQTPLRRFLIRLAPGHEPTGWRARLLLRAAYRAAGFADWAGVRLEALICELEEPRRREAWAECWQRRLWFRLIRTRWLFWPSERA